MSNKILDMFEELNDEPTVREGTLVKAPFSYPGGKQKSLRHILPMLPDRAGYVEPFGGSAAVLLAKRKSKMEVYNDRFGGVTDFYRCLRDSGLCDRLVQWLDLTIHSREAFEFCKSTWKDHTDIVERAARWYYMTMYSFGSQGRNFGRGINPKCILSGRVREKLIDFWPVHERLKTVLIENQDWRMILKDFDGPDVVFYLDPPYIDANRGIYKNEMTYAQHQQLLETIMGMDGFVALSSYPNGLYDSYEWDDFKQWDHTESTTSMAFTESNHKSKQQQVGRSKVKEALYIKEAR